MHKFRKLPLCLLVCISLSLTNCDSCDREEETPTPEADISQDPPCAPLEVSTTNSNESSENKTATFVITKIRFGNKNEGLDLDCVSTPDGCKTDVCREGPDDGEKGVDNHLGVLAHRISSMGGSDLQAEMSEAVESFRHPLLIRLVEATDFANGKAKSVEIDFGLPVSSYPEHLRSGQGLVTDDPDAPNKRPSSFSPVSIRNGVVKAGPTRDWMPLFWTRGQIAAVPVEKAYITFKISTPPQGERFEKGVIDSGILAGGIGANSLSGSILDMDARTAKVLQSLGFAVRGLIRTQRDLDLIPPGKTARSCQSDRDCMASQSCDRGHCFEPEGQDTISFAVMFEGVSALETSSVNAGDADIEETQHQPD